eukprot:scaffold57943_cov81-Cyclotella_meneghiniana.AAC.1
MAVGSEDHHGPNVKGEREARGERQGDRSRIKGDQGHGWYRKVGSNLPQKIFVAPKVFKNC